MSSCAQCSAVQCGRHVGCGACRLGAALGGALGHWPGSRAQGIGARCSAARKPLLPCPTARGAANTRPCRRTFFWKRPRAARSSCGCAPSGAAPWSSSLDSSSRKESVSGNCSRSAPHGSAAAPKGGCRSGVGGAGSGQQGEGRCGFGGAYRGRCRRLPAGGEALAPRLARPAPRQPSLQRGAQIKAPVLLRQLDHRDRGISERAITVSGMAARQTTQGRAGSTMLRPQHDP